MFGSEITFDEAIFITLFSVLVVFLVLAILVLLIKVTATVLNRNKEEKKEEKAAPATQSAAPAAVSQTVGTKDIDKKNKDKVILLTAAVAAYRSSTNASGDFVVRKFRQVANNESPWILASRNYK